MPALAGEAIAASGANLRAASVSRRLSGAEQIIPYTFEAFIYCALAGQHILRGGNKGNGLNRSTAESCVVELISFPR